MKGSSGVFHFEESVVAIKAFHEGEVDVRPSDIPSSGSTFEGGEALPVAAEVAGRLLPNVITSGSSNEPDFVVMTP